MNLTIQTGMFSLAMFIFMKPILNLLGASSNTSLFLGVMRWVAFNIPMLFILNAIFGMYGIVWSQVTADVLTVTLSALSISDI